jgi:hypothetical protein
MLEALKIIRNRTPEPVADPASEAGVSGK